MTTRESTGAPVRPQFAGLHRSAGRGGAGILRAAAGTAASLAVALAVANPASARVVVDPSTLNPAPPDYVNATCVTGAGGVVCDLAFSDDPVVNEPSGFVCAGTELDISLNRSVVGKRYYDQNGDLTRRHFREDVSGTFANPDTGESVPWTQNDTVVHDLAVPGDLGTGTVKSSGLGTRIWLPGGGTILVDSGVTRQAAGTGDILHTSANHPFEDYFVRGDATALVALCAALS
jgi:hypothetical protein